MPKDGTSTRFHPPRPDPFTTPRKSRATTPSFKPIEEIVLSSDDDFTFTPSRSFQPSRTNHTARTSTRPADPGPSRSTSETPSRPKRAKLSTIAEEASPRHSAAESPKATSTTIPFPPDAVTRHKHELMKSIPDVHPEYAEALIKVNMISNPESVVASSLEHILHLSSFPKLVTTKRKVDQTSPPRASRAPGPPEPASEAGPSTPKRTRIDWSSHRRKISSKRYAAWAQWHLGQDFRLIKKSYITTVLLSKSGLYYPAYFYLREVSQQPGHEGLKATATPKGPAPLARCQEFDQERQAVIDQLDRERDGGRKEEAGSPVSSEDSFDSDDAPLSPLQSHPAATPAPVPASADSPREAESASSDTTATGIAIECGACFDDMQSSTTIRCPSGHAFCSACVRNHVEDCLRASQDHVPCLESTLCSDAFGQEALFRAFGEDSVNQLSKLRRPAVEAEKASQTQASTTAISPSPPKSPSSTPPGPYPQTPERPKPAPQPSFSSPVCRSPSPPDPAVLQAKECLERCREACERRSWQEARVAWHAAKSVPNASFPSLLWELDAEILMGCKNWDQAIRSTNDALLRYPDSPDLLTHSAWVMLLTNHIEHCTERLKAALRLHPDHARALRLFKRVKSIAVAKDEGDGRYKAKDFLRAVEKYTEALTLIGQSEAEGDGCLVRAALLSNRAAAHVSLRHFTHARDDCLAALTLQSSSPSIKTLLRLARCYLALGDPTTALQTANAALNLESRNPLAVKSRDSAKRMLQYIENFKKAREEGDWRMATSLLSSLFLICEGGKLLEWSVWEIEVALAIGSYPEAEQLAKKLCRSNPASPQAVISLALALLISNKLQESRSFLKSLQSSLAADPSVKDLSLRVDTIIRTKENGDKFFKGEKWQEAQQAYTDLLNTIGEAKCEGRGGIVRSVALSNRAAVYYKMSKFSLGKEDAQASIDLHRPSFRAWRNLARAQMALGFYQDALAACHNAMQYSSSATTSEQNTLHEEAAKAQMAIQRVSAKDYYWLLNVNRAVSPTDLKKAYHRASLVYHPDKGGNPEHFKMILQAYETLSDPSKRALLC